MTELTGGRPIRPVILAGGAGTRLWPLSTVERPKHLLPLLGKRSLFEQTLDRFGEQFSAPIIVANRAQEADLRSLLGQGATILLEPCKRDSAAAIALAALVCLCRRFQVKMIDCQQNTAHLASLGAREMSRDRFVAHVANARLQEGPQWHFEPVYWTELLSTRPSQST